MAHSYTTDPRYKRFTVWPDQYGPTTPSMSSTILRADDSLCEFYAEPFDETEIQRIARERGVEDATTEFKCFLDWIYPWLVEGDATLVCPTYEEYLLAIVGLIELQRYQSSEPGISRRLELADEERDGFDIFYWGIRPRKRESIEVRTFGLLRTADVDEWHWRNPDQDRYGAHLPLDWGGLEHPALRKDVYKAARRRNRQRRSA